MGPTRKLAELEARYDGKTLRFNCPCNRCKDIRDNPEEERNAKWCDAIIRIPIAPEQNGWTLVSGTTTDDLTLQPSIKIGNDQYNAAGGCEGWHGYLTNGVLVACE